MIKRYVFIPAIWIIVLVLWALPALAEMIVDTAWVRRYNGPGDGGDSPRSIAVDDSGNVYITGGSYGNGTNTDYATIKYDPSGNELWVSRYNGPANDWDEAVAIALDDSGNVYVTGRSAQGTWPYSDYVTIKYYPTGDTAWVRRYDGPASINDEARAIAVDSSGNAYVTGGSANDYATIKYCPNGDTAWIRRYNGSANSYDGAYDIAIDNSGNVCVTGYSEGSGTQQDCITIKYKPDGDTAWVRRYNGPTNYPDAGKGLAVDSLYNIYVTGISVNAAFGSADYLTLKYDQTGNRLWVTTYNGVGGWQDEPEDIAMDGSGNVSVTGRSFGYNTSFDWATIKYYPDGDTAWVRRYNGSDDSTDYAHAVTIDGSGNIYVTGESWRPVGFSTQSDYVTIKYDQAGNELWLREYNGPANENDWAKAIAIDGSNNVYVTGPSDGIGTRLDYATIKYFQAWRGDANIDGLINIADVVHLINYLFTSGSAPDPLQIGDCNCDDVVDIADVVFLINYLFTGGSPPNC